VEKSVLNPTKVVMFIVILSMLTAYVGCGFNTKTYDSSRIPAKEENADDTVYILMPDSKIARWYQFDLPNFKESFKKYSPDLSLKFMFAEGSSARQLAQMEAAIAERARGIILAPADPEQMAGTLMKADREGIPVITYAHEANGGPVKYHVSTSFVKIGQVHGKYLSEKVSKLPAPYKLALIYGDPNFAFYKELIKGYNEYLKPLINAGKVEIIFRGDVLGWDPKNAMELMGQCLKETQKQIDGVLIMNDDIGGAVAAVIAAHGLQGKISIFGGYDATLDGVVRVMTGLQEIDMAPSYKEMTDAAAQLMVSLITGEEPPPGLINAAFDNKYVEGGVPAAYIPSILITKDNVEKTIIKQGIYTKEQLEAGIETYKSKKN
jgi:D-xylose transport system substrate-binding protein